MKIPLLSIFFFAVLSQFVLAQNKTRIGLQGGLNFARQTVNPAVYEEKPIYSLHLTGLLDIPLTKHLYLQPGIALQGKGRKTNTGDYEDGSASSTLNMMYLEIPVNALWKFPVKRFGKLMAGGGPYMAVGLAGKETYTGGDKRKHIFKGNNGFRGYRRGDYGLNFQLGVELNSKFIFRIQEGWGLPNIAPDAYRITDSSGEILSVHRSIIKNRGSSLSVGYLF